MVLKRFYFFLLIPSILYAQVWLGFSFLEKKVPGGIELEVRGVHPNSGALSAGISVGDAVIGVRGKPLQSLGQLQKALQGAKTGSKLPLQIRNDQGQERSLNVELRARPHDLRQFMNSPVGTKVGDLSDNIYANKQSMSKQPKARLLDFWATWCVPCRKTFPLLKNMYDKYHDLGLDIVGLSSESLPVLQEFQKKEQLPWPLLRDINNVQSSYYGVRGLPTLILTDSLGYVQKVWTGAPSPRQLENEIKKLIGL